MHGGVAKIVIRDAGDQGRPCCMHEESMILSSKHYAWHGMAPHIWLPQYS